MARSLHSIKIGTKEQFDKNKGRFGRLFELEGARVYWSEKDDVLIVAPENWRNFFTGTTSNSPTFANKQAEALYDRLQAGREKFKK